MLYSRARTHWLFWTLATGVIGSFLLPDIFSKGNGYFLYFYICLAILIAIHTPNPAAVFKKNARLLIAFVFLFATVWKIMSPDFTSGRFMEFFLLKDDRLGPTAILLTPLTIHDVQANRDRLNELPDNRVQLQSAPGIKILGVVLTWLTLAVEGMTALVFLTATGATRRVRDWTLIVFLVAAYLFIPVPAFGMAFACLGFAQSDSPVAKGFINSYL